MRTAICFSGFVGGLGGKDNKGTKLKPHHAFNLNKTTLFEANKPDFFIHSWSCELEDELVKLYQPKKILVEPQIDLDNSDVSKLELTIKEQIGCFFSRSKRNEINKKNKEKIFRYKSKWYSTLKSAELMASYEKKNFFEYDAVMLLRLDIGFYSGLTMTAYDLTKMWASNWNVAPSVSNNFKGDFSNLNTDKSLLDFWFFSNSRNIKNFAGLYNEFNKYHPDPHTASFQRIKDLNLEIGYTKYRWFDHEMVRRREFGVQT